MKEESVNEVRDDLISQGFSWEQALTYIHEAIRNGEFQLTNSFHIIRKR